MELNRAVAVSMASGPAAGLELVDALVDGTPPLAAYHLLPAVRGDLLVKLGRPDEARAEFERAASLTRNERERTLLLARAAAAPEALVPPRAGRFRRSGRWTRARHRRQPLEAEDVTGITRYLDAQILDYETVAGAEFGHRQNGKSAHKAPPLRSLT